MQQAKYVKILVPLDFSLPDFYNTAGLRQRALALQLGLEAVVHIQKKATDQVRLETHEEAVKEATANYEAKLEELRKETDSLLVKLREERDKAEEAARAASFRVQSLESSATSVRTQTQKEVREVMDELLKAKDDQIQRLSGLLERQVEAMGAKVEGLQNSLTKTFSSSKEKGALGEILMESFLKKAFDCDVQIISKEAQTADIRMCRGNPAATYFWEIKNYTRMVSTEEVEKFRRDLRLHPDVLGGCLVSLRTGIVGKTRGGDVDIEFLEDGRFILYLSNFMAREDPIFTLQGLRPLFDVIEATTKPVKEETEALRALEVKATLIANLLRTHAQVVGKHKNSLLGHKKRMDTMFAEFQGFLLEEEAQLQTLLRVALGGEEAAEEAAEELETHLSPVVFSKATLNEIADEREKEFVKWLLGLCEVQEGKQVEVKELLEKAKEAKFADKFVRGLRETLFQDAAWSKGSRYILGLQWSASAEPTQEA